MTSEQVLNSVHQSRNNHKVRNCFLSQIEEMRIDKLTCYESESHHLFLLVDCLGLVNLTNVRIVPSYIDHSSTSDVTGVLRGAKRLRMMP